MGMGMGMGMGGAGAAASDATTGREISGDGPARQQVPRPEQSVGVERELAHRATVDAFYRRHAIDQGCARVEKLEREISPRPCAASKPKTSTGP
jgi:hypothetical protein